MYRDLTQNVRYGIGLDSVPDRPSINNCDKLLLNEHVSLCTRTFNAQKLVRYYVHM